jgi:SAM-dependent methyltransferase
MSSIVKEYNKISIYAKILLFLIFFLFIITLTKKTTSIKTLEGFELGQKILFSNQLFDSFYVSIYDYLTMDQQKNQFELYTFFKQTSPNNKSIILSVGSKTGHQVNEISQLLNCSVTGIDISKEMIEYSKKKYPTSSFFQLDVVLHPEHFSSQTFTHITCLNFQIYYVKEKKMFFQNVSKWLKNNGYLLLHLVNREKVVSILPPQYLNHRDNHYEFKTKIDFNEFRYDSVLVPLLHENKSIFQEGFTFHTGEKRKQEHELFMEDHESILQIARKYGFIVQGKIHMNVCQYNHQYLYILQKTF